MESVSALETHGKVVLSGAAVRRTDGLIAASANWRMMGTILEADDRVAW